MNETDETKSELENKIKNGSISAYHTYGIACIDDEQFGDYYRMSKIMSDKYYYPPAYYEVFICICDRVNNYYNDDKYSLEKLSNNDKEEAINYLKNGAILGDKDCIDRIKTYILEKRYFTIADTIMFNSEKYRATTVVGVRTNNR